MHTFRTTSFSIFISLILLVFTATAATQALAESEWKQLGVPVSFVDSNHNVRMPNCSGGPLLTTDGPESSFSYFIRKGNPRKLLIALDGGGACWDSNTCIGSVLAGTPVYTLAVDETVESLDELSGVFDLNQKANPFADYTQVFVPYCTADIHWGSNDKTYYFPSEGNPQVSRTIHHRGYDNFLAVLEGIKKYYKSNNVRMPDKVVASLK